MAKNRWGLSDIVKEERAKGKMLYGSSLNLKFWLYSKTSVGMNGRFVVKKNESELKKKESSNQKTIRNEILDIMAFGS